MYARKIRSILLELGCIIRHHFMDIVMEQVDFIMYVAWMMKRAHNFLQASGSNASYVLKHGPGATLYILLSETHFLSLMD